MIADKEETDPRLDKGIEIMEKMLVAIENVNRTLIDMNSNLGGKMDQMLQKQDVMIQKQDQMFHRQDKLLIEVKDMDRGLNDKRSTESWTKAI